MITLRDNQKEAVAKAIAYFKQKKKTNIVPSLIVLPTAWGKSILTAFVAKECKDKLLVVQPSKELLEQNYAKYQLLCGGEAVDARIYSASCGKKEIGQITYATIGSIKNIGKTFKEMGFTKMLIDEAHLYPREGKSMLGQFLKDSGIKHVLGITATPLKLLSVTTEEGKHESRLIMLCNNYKYKVRVFFKKILYVGQVSEMVKKGYWSKLQYEIDEFDTRWLEYNSTGAEYTEDSIQMAYAWNGGRQKVIDAVEKHAERKSILVFMPSVEEAVEICKGRKDWGFVHGAMNKKEREEALRKFKEGETRVMCNFGVLTTGYDNPKIDCIIFARSTASFAMYYQMVGRGTRIDPDKADCLIIDQSGIVNKFGHVEDIEIKCGMIWRVFGSNERLITGIPIDQIGSITMAHVRQVEAETKEKREHPEMPFGKYKGQKLTDIPKGYLSWMLTNMNWEGKELLKEQVKMTLAS